MLRVEDLSVDFSGRQVLDGVSFDVGATESLAIMGRSGSGKSTLLACILGLLRPTAGSVHVDGVQVRAGRGSAARLRREKLGMIFQAGELLAELTPLENVAVTGLLAGQSNAEAYDRARDLLRALDVPSRKDLVGTFSGGEQQRVAVARALMNRPVLLLGDEPTGSLDHETRAEVVRLLHQLPNDFGCAMVLVTHDREVAASCASRVHLRDGRLEGQTSQGAM